MSRRHLTFSCEGDRLFGTLDEGIQPVGVMLVTGGNETRSGAFSGQALIASVLAARGFPVFRFDRRGVGDSEGANGGFRSSGPDIAAALAKFRAECPQMKSVVGFGNCDAASALMLARGAGLDALVLANPWTFDEGETDAMPAEAVRARYAAKLRDPAEWLRLARGGVSFTKLARGLRKAADRSAASSNLAQEMRAAMDGYPGSLRYLVAGRDRTGQAFRSAWRDKGDIAVCGDADHAFSTDLHREWLVAQIASVLEEQARQLDMR